MAERILFIGWGTPVRGREQQAVEAFDAGVVLFWRMQRQGRVAHVDVGLLEPATGLGGWVALHGSPEQLAAVREDDAFRRALIASELVVDDLRLSTCATGEAVAREMEAHHRRRAAVPQLT